MPINYIYYAPNWKDVVRPEALKRAGYRCQRCKAPNKALIWRDKSGDWTQFPESDIQRGFVERKNLTKIILTIAHLNHLTFDNRPENLQALCQKCHLHHDLPHKLKMKKVHPLLSVDKLLTELEGAGGELALPVAFAKLRGLTREAAQLENILKRRPADLFKSDYDKELRKRLQAIKADAQRLKIIISKLLTHAFKITNPEDYFAAYLSPDSYFAAAVQPISRNTGLSD